MKKTSNSIWLGHFWLFCMCATANAAIITTATTYTPALGPLNNDLSWSGDDLADWSVVTVFGTDYLRNTDDGDDTVIRPSDVAFNFFDSTNCNQRWPVI